MNRLPAPRAPRHFALIALCLALLSACGGSSEWQELTISEGGFSVLMRGQARYARQPVDTPGGKTSAHLYSSDRPDAFFAVGYSDYPLAFVLASRPEDLLNGVRDTWIRRIEGKLLVSSPVKLQGQYSGIEFMGEGAVKGESAFLHARVFLVDQRLYQVISMARKNQISQGVINRYLNSFRIVPASESGMIQLGPQPGEK